MTNEFFLFFMDNKSGWKTNEKILSVKEPKIYEEIKKYSELYSFINLPFKEQVWLFINKYTHIPKCSECGKNLKFKRSLREGYGKFCSLSCTNKNSDHISSSKKTWLLKKDDITNTIKKTNLERYGVENTFQDLSLVKNGFQKKHGVDHVSKVVGVKEKIRKTFLEKYGVTSNFKKKKLKYWINEKEQFQINLPNLKFIDHTGKILCIECDVCNKPYSINRTLFRHRIIYGKIPCTNCNPLNSGDSFFEKEIYNFIKNIHSGHVIENDRTILKPKEIDIYVPDLKIGFEFNGLYFHSSKFVGDNFHLGKTTLSESRGVNLLHIFEDEWVNKKDIVKSIIKTRLNKFDRIIYGRKCKVKYIDSFTYKKFCQENHIQGPVNSLIKLGLYHNDELVSIMSFGNLRKSLGSTKKDGVYEMLRFCNKLNTSVIGGGSKLFKFFINKYQPTEVISFSDKRYFTGSIYPLLGFQYEKDTKPNYFYITDYLVRENRFKFRKDVLVKDGYDENKSERQIMEERGIHRIYDCGNKKWVWKK